MRAAPRRPSTAVTVSASAISRIHPRQVVDRGRPLCCGSQARQHCDHSSSRSAARTGRCKERAPAEALSAALGGLPLAHEQAAAYCERLEISCADYTRRLAATPAKMLDAERDAPAEYHDRLTVAKTFALAIDKAARLHPAAEPLIVHAALLAPEPFRCSYSGRDGRISASRLLRSLRTTGWTRPWRRYTPSRSPSNLQVSVPALDGVAVRQT